MLPEYDFSGGVRGKHAEAYREGHTVRIHRADKTLIEHHFTLEDGAVMLEPDVREYFADKVFKTIIPRNVRLSEAPSFGKPIGIYDRHSVGSITYENLAKEVLRNG